MIRPYLPIEIPPGHERWQPAEFDIAWSSLTDEPCVARVRGCAFHGIGLHLASRMMSRYRRKDGTRRTNCVWVVTHLNTGHVVYRIAGVSADVAFSAAADLDELADWDFTGLDGWRNMDPDLPAKVASWRVRHGLAKAIMHGGRSDASARSIASRRS